MDIFVNNWLPTLLLLFISGAAWFAGHLLPRKSGLGRATLSAVSILANVTLAFLAIVWGGGLAHIMAVFVLALLLNLR